MCRLLGVVSRVPAPLPDLLDDSLGQFTALAREHRDGWGMAYWDDERLTIAKDPSPLDPTGAFTPTITGATTDAALLHIRMANDGPAPGVHNTHPFVMDAKAFAHNGDFAPATAIEPLIDADLLPRLRGGTDSERFFLLVTSAMRRREPARALIESAAKIRASTTISSLNCLLLTRDALYAYAEHDPIAPVSRRRGPGFFSLSYRIEANRVLVASSGWPQPTPPWTRIKDGEVVEVRRHDLSVSRHVADAA